MSVTRLLSILGAVVAIIPALAIPLLYLGSTYWEETRNLSLETTFNARSVEQVVAARPDLWEYETLRLFEIVSGPTLAGQPEERILRNATGKIVVRTEYQARAPYVVSTIPFFDSGRRVGSVEGRRSIRDALRNTVLFGLVGLAVGALIWVVYRSYPLRIIDAGFRTIAEEKNRAAATLQAIGDGVLAIDPQGKIVLMNGVAEGLLGWTASEALGNPIDEVYVTRQEQPPPGGRSGVSRTVVSRNGTERAIEEIRSSIAHPTGGNIGTVIAVRDVTERTRLEEQLSHSQRLEAIGTLAGGIAHDFNNMLTIIIGNAELARTGLALEDERYTALSGVLQAAARSADLTRQLLAFARKQTVSPKTLELNDAVSSALRMLRRLIGEDIELRWIPGHDVRCVRIDPTQFDQILANLAVNARDAIEGVGTLTLKTESVTVEKDQWPGQPDVLPGTYVLLTVADTGMGMAKDILDRAFEPFFTTKDVGKGTGLGLSTVFGIVRQNGGYLEVSSEPGKGSTFRVYLPRHDAEAVAKPDAVDVRVTAGYETILLAEDDGEILETVRRTLEGAGYTVLAAQGPRSALRQAEECAGTIHLLLTDVVMPEMNGRDLAERLRQARPGLACLYMSGYTGDIIANRGALDEGVHFISKPFRKDGLLRAVRKVMDKGHGSGRLRGGENA